MNQNVSDKKRNVPMAVIILFAVVAVCLLALAGYYFYLTYATLYTYNGISVLEAPYFRSRAILLTASGIVATAADVYLVKMNSRKN